MSSSTTVPSALITADERYILHTIHATLRIVFGLVPIAAGLDKFANILTSWDQYLNPVLLRIIPLSAFKFMHVVGVVEIVAGLLVLAKPRIGAFVVTAWLGAIALQLLAGWMYVDVAVRDLVLATGALTLARLTPIVDHH